MLTKNNIVQKLESYNKFFYENNIRAFNIATIASEDMQSGVGKLVYAYLGKE